MALAQRAGLGALAEELVSVPGSAGAHASAKVAAVVAGMVAGADSFEDLAVLRHGAMPRVLAVAPAPTTLGTHLRVPRQADGRFWGSGELGVLGSACPRWTSIGRFQAIASWGRTVLYSTR